LAKQLGDKEITDLKRLANILLTASMNVSNNQAKKEAAPAPRVEVIAAPRVEKANDFVPIQQTLTTSPHNNIKDDGGPPLLPHSNVIKRTCANDGTAQKHYNTRAANKINQTTIQDYILSTIKTTNTPITSKQLASRCFPIQLLNKIYGAVFDNKTGKRLEFKQLISRPKYREQWGISYGNKLGQLTQGMPRQVKGTDSMCFIKYD
jgi:hypothetical protein